MFPLLAVSFLTACGGGAGVAPGAHPHDMSESGHENAAAREEAKADVHRDQYDPDATSTKQRCGTPPIGLDTIEPCWTSVTNPTAEHLEMAKRHERAAADHRAASQTLQRAEEQSCGGVARADRDISPFAHTEDIESVEILDSPSAPKGAKIVFRPVRGLTAEVLNRQVQCHLARNTSLGFHVEEMAYCPLAVKGVKATVENQAGNVAVVLESNDPASAAELVKRAQALSKK
jgi:hypothetical protein